LAWWYTLAISEFGSLRQDDREFETVKTLSQKERKKKEKKNFQVEVEM
jgi:hypothetical protein